LEFCDGGSVVLTANGGDNYTWNTGEQSTDLTVSSTASHSVSTQYGSLVCESALVNVTVHPLPTSQFIVDDIGFATGQDIIFTNQSTGATKWNWDFGDGETSSVESPSHSYSAIGEYLVSLTAISDEDCAVTETKTIGIITGTETSLERHITLYPNPVHGEGFLINSSGDYEAFDIKIFNAQGRLVLEAALKTTGYPDFVDLSYLANGIYQVQVSTENGMLMKKIVVARK
jgi:PKD repeat protein